MPTTSQLTQQIHDCEIELQAHRGYLKALEYGLRAMIISHPDPAKLVQTWQQLLPGIADTHSGGDTPLFLASLRQGLSMLTEQIDEAAAPK